MRIETILAAMLFFSAFLYAPANAKSFEEESPALVQALAKQLVIKKKPKIAALDFTDIQGRPNELGRFLAEQLSVDMVMAEGIIVLDRANISAIMAEHQLTAEGLVNPANAKKLGQFAGVDAILIGNLAPMDNVVILTVKAISTETAEVVAAGRIKFDTTKDIQRMLGQGIAGGSLTGEGANASGAETIASPAIDVGPLTVATKNISLSVADGFPQIRIVFNLENHDLAKIVAVSANAFIQPTNTQSAPTVGRIFGVLQDSNQKKWPLFKQGILGIPIIYCFETENDISGGIIQGPPPLIIRQNAPSNIVDYIKNGLKYNGNEELEHKTQRRWAGSFASIDAGKKMELTALFLPTDFLSPNRTPIDGKTYVWPEFADLSLELVVATHREGEDPAKAKDLALRVLNINHLVLSRPNSKVGM